MSTIRKISGIIDGQKTSDGAGVSLLRVFGFYETNLFDPFLLLDFFGSENPIKATCMVFNSGSTFLPRTK